jgi:spore maturation protein CgeB
MPLDERILGRWPALASRLQDAPPGSGDLLSGEHGPLLKDGGRSLHSPRDPAREAARLVAEAFPWGVPERVWLVGHGLGDEVAALVAGGCRRVELLAPEAGLLALALGGWRRPELLDPGRLGLWLPEDDPPPPTAEDGWFEWPATRRCRPEFVASARVRAGRRRADAWRLKILVVEPIYGGSLPMARSAAAALRRLGHEVRSLDCSALEPAHAWLLDFADRHPGALSATADFTRLLGRLLLVEARDFRPDLVLALAQSPATPEAAEALRSEGARTAFWFVEDFETLEYWKGLHGHFDLFLTIQRGRFHGQLARLASSPVRYLPACAELPAKPPVWTGPGPAPQLSFVGAPYHNRERFFLQLLETPLRIWGEGWDLRGPLASRIEGGGRRTDADFNRRLFASGGIQLNLHSSRVHDGVDPHGDFVNPRTFEILACGGFQLVDRRSLLPELLQPGEDLVVYGDAAELRDQLAQWSADPEGRARIAARGQARVRQRHGYDQRMAELLELLTLLGEDPFPHARRRDEERLALDGDPAFAAWLRELPAGAPRELAPLAAWLRSRGQPLDETGLLLLFMDEVSDWSRRRGIDRMLEQARHG